MEKQILVIDPVYYRHVYADDGSLSGVIVDYEQANDFHYELTGEGWKQFSDRYLQRPDEAQVFDEVQAFRDFLTANKGLFAFEHALQEAQIGYKKITF